jgi:hypothetical protein
VVIFFWGDFSLFFNLKNMNWTHTKDFGLRKMALICQILTLKSPDFYNSSQNIKEFGYRPDMKVEKFINLLC